MEERKMLFLFFMALSLTYGRAEPEKADVQSTETIEPALNDVKSPTPAQEEFIQVNPQESKQNPQERVVTTPEELFKEDSEIERRRRPYPRYFPHRPYRPYWRNLNDDGISAPDESIQTNPQELKVKMEEKLHNEESEIERRRRPYPRYYPHRPYRPYWRNLNDDGISAPEESIQTNPQEPKVTMEEQILREEPEIERRRQPFPRYYPYRPIWRNLNEDDELVLNDQVVQTSQFLPQELERRRRFYVTFGRRTLDEHDGTEDTSGVRPSSQGPEHNLQELTEAEADEQEIERRRRPSRSKLLSYILLANQLRPFRRTIAEDGEEAASFIDVPLPPASQVVRALEKSLAEEAEKRTIRWNISFGSRRSNLVDSEDVADTTPLLRVTCDFGSASVSYGPVGVTMNHALCAGHCVYKGFRGGWCDSKAVCNCRR